MTKKTRIPQKDKVTSCPVKRQDLVRREKQWQNWVILYCLHRISLTAVRAGGVREKKEANLIRPKRTYHFWCEKLGDVQILKWCIGEDRFAIKFLRQTKNFSAKRFLLYWNFSKLIQYYSQRFIFYINFLTMCDSFCNQHAALS